MFISLNMIWLLLNKSSSKRLNLWNNSTVDSWILCEQRVDRRKTILASCAQGSLLDVDFGSYPFVTSLNTVTAGSCNRFGRCPKTLVRFTASFKAYATRVGSGPFPDSELLGCFQAERMRQEGRVQFNYRSSCSLWMDWSSSIEICDDDHRRYAPVMMKADGWIFSEEINICTVTNCRIGTITGTALYDFNRYNK